MDPVQAINLVVSGFRAAGAVGKFMEQREKRKTVESRQAAAASAAQLASLSPEEREERSEGFRREIFVVLGVLGEKLLNLGVVNEAWLPFARDEVLKTLRIKGQGFRALFEQDMEEAMQFAVTAAMFLCAGCWPMPIYRGFGACVMNEWFWASPNPAYPRPNDSETTQLDDCIALLKTATQGHDVLTRYPSGLSQMSPFYVKKDEFDIVWYLDHKNSQIKKRGLPKPKDGTFRVTEMTWPWSTYDSQFTLQNRYSQDFGKISPLLEWQQDPGRMIYGFVVGGFLDLQPGQMVEPTSEIATSILEWLSGLNGMTFKIVRQSELDISHWKLKAKHQKRWDAGLGAAIYAIRDENLVQKRNAARMSVIPGKLMSSASFISTSSTAVPTPYTTTPGPPPYTPQTPEGAKGGPMAGAGVGTPAPFVAASAFAVPPTMQAEPPVGGLAGPPINGVSPVPGQPEHTSPAATTTYQWTTESPAPYQEPQPISRASTVPITSPVPLSPYQQTPSPPQPAHGLPYAMSPMHPTSPFPTQPGINSSMQPQAQPTPTYQGAPQYQEIPQQTTQQQVLYEQHVPYQQVPYQQDAVYQQQQDVYRQQRVYQDQTIYQGQTVQGDQASTQQPAQHQYQETYPQPVVSQYSAHQPQGQTSNDQPAANTAASLPTMFDSLSITNTPTHRPPYTHTPSTSSSGLASLFGPPSTTSREQPSTPIYPHYSPATAVAAQPAPETWHEVVVTPPMQQVQQEQQQQQYDQHPEQQRQQQGQYQRQEQYPQQDQYQPHQQHQQQPEHYQQQQHYPQEQHYQLQPQYEQQPFPVSSSPWAGGTEWHEPRQHEDHGGDGHHSPPRAFSLREVEAQFDFSARSTGQISFRRGDVLEILRDSNGDGWLLARKDGVEGRVPEAYVTSF